MVSCGSTRKSKQVKDMEPQIVLPQDSLVRLSAACLNCCGAGTESLPFALLRKVSENSREDVLLSPLSLSYALGLAASGADAQTLEELDAVLGLSGASRDSLSEHYRAMTQTLNASDTSVAFESANSIWVDRGFTLKKEFVENAQRNFDAQAQEVYFRKPSAAKRINSWCDEKTRGKIPSVVDKTSGWKTALVNAVYFKGAWSEEFDRVSDGEFTCADGSVSTRKFMRRKDIIPYAGNETYQMVELPYGEEEEFVLDVLLPRDKSMLSPLPSEKEFKTLVDSVDYAHVNLRLPEFRIESSTELGAILQSLGVHRAFSEQAQFPYISDVPLMIDRVFQKAFIDIDRKGTEAAAVTVISMRVTSAGPGFEPKYIDFIADRPFVFVLREKRSGEILFIGRKSQ